MEKKKAYYVSDSDGEYGIFVVAESVKHAKRMSWGHECLCNEEYIDLKAKWNKKVKVDDLEYGVQDDFKEGLRRGVFSFLDEGYDCDECESEAFLTKVGDKCLCSDCEDKLDKTEPSEVQKR